LQPHRISEIGSKIGKKAGVVASREGGKVDSLHDLRRAFDTRWAPNVKPATLQLLMRLADNGATMKYYVAQDAADVADELWVTFTLIVAILPATLTKKPKTRSQETT
jgi:hypothetical protein